MNDLEREEREKESEKVSFNFELDKDIADDFNSFLTGGQLYNCQWMLDNMDKKGTPYYNGVKGRTRNIKNVQNLMFPEDADND